MISFSIIIPSFNSGNDVFTCIKSLSKLRYPKNKYEIIVVDDGSTDKSINKLKKLKISNLKVFYIKNNGAAFARNYGVDKSKNDIIVFLDQDVIVKNNLLQEYRKTFLNTDADAVQGNIWEQIVKSSLTKDHSNWRKISFFSKVVDNGNFIKTIVTRNTAVKKNVLNTIKNKNGFIFNESFGGTGGEDRDLGYRLYKLNFKIYFNPDVIVKHKDPDNIIDILFQKYKHAQGDVKFGIGERTFDYSNFKRVVVTPTIIGVPFHFAFLLWLFHVTGAEVQRTKQNIGKINTVVYYKVKRLVDITGSLTGLVLGLPFLLLIGLLIKLNSKGSIIFKQKRVSIGWKEFEMLKFRTMVEDAEKILYQNPKLLMLYKQSNYKIKEDPRVTLIGKFLRKFSLDEIPQLVNVLKGDMSLVGPRAYKKDEIKNQLKIHPELDIYTNIVIGTRPGLTGVWQVSGRSEVGFAKRFLMDYGYASKRNIFFDIFIILKTIPVVLKSRGAW